MTQTNWEKLADYDDMKADWVRMNRELDEAHLVVNILLVVLGLILLAVLLYFAVVAQFLGGIGF